MKHTYRWPWRLAYQSCTSSPFSYHTRSHSQHGRGGGADFGVRRPLRYLTHQLDLDESQTRRMAVVLNQLKTEREQARLDEQRSVTALAELMAGATPTIEEASRVLAPRIDSARQLTDVTAKAIVAISDLLDPDQREEFSELLLTGAISL